ncbi:Uncharacterized protein conserved in bacteria [Candidatus Ornithobacterium hominis]|uniref:LPS export ABC transporter periplasmic protein LptC n=1 Tax=Candidatus Ornithobacterium hominis TaxID=2497989 RepID=UPI000E5B6A37|nr:LPS export ABC transporter periplasmic protein LptC [Candidatus Ornithobacterium hominis]SZD71795.1 Uncharacterized protein conserved in bacteria [Candidatus Ornithobacterium hominis]
MFLKIYFKAALFILAALILYSCEIKKTEEKGPLNKNFSDQTIFNAEVIYKDSGLIRMKLNAPLIENFTLIDSPYTLMRRGVEVSFWNRDENEPNFLRANWAKLQDKKKMYEGRGNVVMINNDGDTLKTEQIYWDNKNRRIFTDKSVTIKRMDGTVNVSQNGIEASEDFKEFTLKNNSGVIAFERQKPALAQSDSILKDSVTFLDLNKKKD